MNDRALSLARELEHRDDQLAEAIEGVEELLAAVEAISDRCTELAAELARAPEREAVTAEALARARSALVAARHEVERARAERLEAEGTAAEEGIAAARAGEEQALAGLRRADERLARAAADAEGVRRDAERARNEAASLEGRAAELSATVAAQPRVSREGAVAPGPGLEGAGRWASHARAALWVVRSGLQTERERVVREANELAASVLGGPHGATSVALVRERLERG